MDNSAVGSAGMEIDWFDELELDPAAHPVAMGTRALGDRPWLVVDYRAIEELALKDRLLGTERAEVLYTTEASRHAAARLADLVGAPPDNTGMHPIERAARYVQEDLCLLERRSDGWFLDASCLCFPTRWRLLDKVDQHIATVHGPVDGYDARITSKVDQLFDRLTERPVWRRNWFLMTDPALYQPTRPPQETIVAADQVLSCLFIRSERQTLRRLDDNWVVFTIRIQQETLGALLTTDERRAAFANWVAEVSDDFGHRRHLTEPQRRELLSGLG